MSRSLGVDYGTKRIGLALSDGLGLTASPLEVVPNSKALTRLAEIVDEHQVEQVIIGIPTALGGFEGEMAIAARAFGAAVEDRTGIAVEYADERFTSRLAEDALLESGMKRQKRREAVDKVAAAIILQGYLDAKRRNGNSIST